MEDYSEGSSSASSVIAKPPSRGVMQKRLTKRLAEPKNVGIYVILCDPECIKFQLEYILSPRFEKTYVQEHWCLKFPGM